MTPLERKGLLRKANTPLSIIAIFSVIAEIAMTATLFQIDKSMQPTFIWFVMLYPILLVVLFFFTLYTRPAVLFSPSDYAQDASYLSSINQKAEIKLISGQVTDIKEMSRTLQSYLEAVVEKVAPDDSSNIITQEKHRLEEAHHLVQLKDVPLYQFLTKELGLSYQLAEVVLVSAKTFDSLPEKVFAETGSARKRDRTQRLITEFPVARMDFEKIKQLTNN